MWLVPCSAMCDGDMPIREWKIKWKRKQNKAKKVKKNKLEVLCYMYRVYLAIDFFWKCVCLPHYNKRKC